MKIINKYIKRCFDIAKIGKGATSPNPTVGSVIVFEDQIIGEGWHKKYASAHAEVNAFASVAADDKSVIEQATIYVSLEPCFHFGKTPPCVDLLLEKNISKVSIAFKDPNPKVEGKSVAKLKAENKNVTVCDKSDWCKERHYLQYYQTLNPFFTNIRHKRPYIILKWAESADGYIGKENERVQISNELSKRLVHKWRSECDGILIGTNTAIVDNPELTNRYFFGKSPVRIIIDKNNRIPKNHSILDDTHTTYVYTCNNLHENNNKHNTHFVPLDFKNNMINNLLTDLLSKNIAILFVEGGAKILESFIASNMWDEARVIKSDTILRGGIPAPSLSPHFKIGSEQLDDNRIDFYMNDTLEDA